MKHLVDTTEIALNRQIRMAQIEFFLPRLKEHKQLIETMMQEMEETFAEKLLSQSQSTAGRTGTAAWLQPEPN